MIGVSFLRAGCFMFLTGILAGCSLHQYSEEAPVKTVEGTGKHHGYALLFGLLSDEKDLEKLLLVKRERAEVRELVKTISVTAGRAHRQLDDFGKADRSLDLKAQGLPVTETATRAAIAKAKGKELLTEGGKEFELRLLLSQNEALTYGMHLAEAVAKGETNPQRIKYLEQLAKDLRALQSKVMELLLANYNWSKPN